MKTGVYGFGGATVLTGRVVLADDKSVEAWAKKLGVSNEELLVAVRKVGTWVPAIARLLEEPKSYR